MIQFRKEKAWEYTAIQSKNPRFISSDVKESLTKNETVKPFQPHIGRRISDEETHKPKRNSHIKDLLFSVHGPSCGLVFESVDSFVQV